MNTNDLRRVRVLINPKSGLSWTMGATIELLERSWKDSGADVTYQVSHSAVDGCRKARQAVEDGVDTIIIVGGDGMINSIGSEMINSNVALGVIPTGSGNGFARHFDIPLDPEKAAKALVNARRVPIDVGIANGQPFFVTYGLAWDGAIARGFEKSPFRGILPYVFSAVFEYVSFAPQPFDIELDGRLFRIDDPVLFTIANLTQYGGGAKIAPQAMADDGYMQLVTVCNKDMPRLLPRLNKLFDGTLHNVSEVQTERFKHLKVRRQRPGPAQIDGELLEDVSELEIEVIKGGLVVLVP